MLGLVEEYWHAREPPHALRPWVATLLDAAAAEHDAGRVIGLLERYHDGRSLPIALEARAGLLLDAEPVRTLRLLLKAFPPSRRERVFAAATSGVDLSAAELEESLLDVLPHAVRVREARRMLRLRRIAETPARHRSITAFLPYEEALPVLDELIRRPDTEDRATGYALLIACAGRTRDPGTLTAALESLGRLRNEQDPVRYAALNALADVPEGLLRGEHAPVAGRFADDALAARDCSHMTRRALGRIAAAFCRQGAIRDDADLVVSGLELVERLVGDTGTLHLGRLDRVLRHGQEHRLMARSRPTSTPARAATTTGSRCCSCGRWAAARITSPVAGRAGGGPRRTQRHRPAAGDRAVARAPGARADRVERVLAKDASAVAVRAVLATIARERTDLLHLVLTENTPPGRFRRADVTYVPRMDASWMRRWTSRQRAEYLDLLDRVAGDEEQPDAVRSSAVAAIGTVPGAGAARLRPYLDSADDGLCPSRADGRGVDGVAAGRPARPPRAHAADHAHVAMYAMTRAARFVRPAELAALLGPALRDGKITSRKEALRILLGNRVPGALGLIEAAWDAPASTGTSARRSSRRSARTWPRTPRGSPHRGGGRPARPRPAGARHTAAGGRGTVPRLLRLARRAGGALGRRRSARGRAAGRPAVGAMGAGRPGDGGRTRRRPRRDERLAAGLDALVGCVTAGFGAAELGAVAATLAAAPDEPSADPERDLPALQRLSALVEAVCEAASLDRDSAADAVAALDGRLPGVLACELAAATFRWDEPGAADSWTPW